MLTSVFIQFPRCSWEISRRGWQRGWQRRKHPRPSYCLSQFFFLRWYVIILSLPSLLSFFSGRDYPPFEWTGISIWYGRRYIKWVTFKSDFLSTKNEKTRKYALKFLCINCFPIMYCGQLLKKYNHKIQWMNTYSYFWFPTSISSHSNHLCGARLCGLPSARPPDVWPSYDSSRAWPSLASPAVAYAGLPFRFLRLASFSFFNSLAIMKAFASCPPPRMQEIPSCVSDLINLTLASSSLWRVWQALWHKAGNKAV